MMSIASARQELRVKPILSIPLTLPSPEHKKAPLPPLCPGKRRWSDSSSLSSVLPLSYTSSGDSQRKDTMLNFLPNALFTALSSVSSSAPLFMLIFLTGVSGLLTGST